MVRNLNELTTANIQQREGHFQGVLKNISLKINMIKWQIFIKKLSFFYDEITNGRKNAIFVLPFFCRKNFDFGVFGGEVAIMHDCYPESSIWESV